MPPKQIKVLVVDDSHVFREVICRGISTDPEIKVVAAAADPFEARDLILKHEPDVMTCDVQMPKMNGIDFIRRLLPQYPLPVVVVSTVSEAVFEALHAGALDFVLKPDFKSTHTIDSFISELVQKIKIAAKGKVNIDTETIPHRHEGTLKHNAGQIIAIGASTGGTEAIQYILKSLPPTIPGTLIVQHIPPIFSRMFAERLNNNTSLTVKEAVNGDYLETGKVLIAPGDLHMRIKNIAGRYKVECFSGHKVNGHCPSVDILFESVAKEARGNAIGVILTGMGYDGAKGLLQMKRKGAKTIGQNQESSVVYGMPKVAFDIGAVETQLALVKIPKKICSLLE